MQASEPSVPARWKGWAREVLTLLAMLLLLSAARSSLANHYHVPSSSMEDTLFPGDRVVVDMRAYGLRIPFTGIELREGRAPEAGDVVVFASPRDGTRLIKRVVAVEGDRVELVQGRLTVNGHPLSLPDTTGRERIGEREVPVKLDRGGGPDLHATVPEGQVLVLGDYRGNSVDGRYFGWVRADALHGRASAVYYRRGEGFVWRRL